MEYDVRVLADGTYVFAAITSSAIKGDVTNVRVGFAKEGQKVKLSTTLSSHMVWMKDAPLMRTEVFSWKGPDGGDLQGIVTYPPDAGQASGPLPTIMLIHGGEYPFPAPQFNGTI